MENEYIIFDTEYTSWAGAQESNWAEPWQEQEVVQIAALKIKGDKVIDSFDCLVRPSKNPLLSEYFTNLTGITNSDIQEHAIGFNRAYNNFIDFARGYVCYSCATGQALEHKSDGVILDINLGLNDSEPKEGIDYRNIAYIIYSLAEEKGVDLPPLASGEMAGHLGLHKDVKKLSKIGDPHYALYDCYSLLVTLNHLQNL